MGTFTIFVTLAEILFSYGNKDLDFFKSEIKNIVKSDKIIYEALDVDIFLYGKTVQRKFRLLRWAYLVFMVGLSLTVFLFFILRIFVT